MDIAKARKKAKGKVPAPEEAASEKTKLDEEVEKPEKKAKPKNKVKASTKKKKQPEAEFEEKSVAPTSPLEREVTQEDIDEISDLPWGSEMPELPVSKIEDDDSEFMEEHLMEDPLDEIPMARQEQVREVSPVESGMPPEFSQVSEEAIAEIFETPVSVSSKQNGDNSESESVMKPASLPGDEGLASHEFEKRAEEDSDLLKYLSFMLANEEYGLELGKINEIIKPKPITEVPRMPDFVVGVLSLRGEIMPIFDLRKRLGLPVSPTTKLTRIIIVEDDERRAGLIVDSVWQVVKISSRTVEPPPSVISGVDAEFIHGIGRCERRAQTVRKATVQSASGEKIDEKIEEKEKAEVEDVVKHLVILLNIDKVISISI